MYKVVLSLMLVTVTLLVLVTPVLAGGWVAVMLDALPSDVRAEQTLDVGFTVRQHAFRPVSDAQPVVFARNEETGASLQFKAEQEGPAGHYVVRVTFPNAGSWEWGVDPKPWPIVHFEPLKVLPATVQTNPLPGAAWWPAMTALIVALGLLLATRRGLVSVRAGAGLAVLAVIVLLVFWQAATVVEGSDSPPPPTDAAYRRALFVAKGCHTCHYGKVSTVVHGPVTGPDLADYRADPAFLRRWLRDPQAVRPVARMPNLGLSDAEINTLIAFLEDGGER